MNKKLFTLAAALMMGSAFTVNAQTNELADKTKATDLSGWYYIAEYNATAVARKYLGGLAVDAIEKTVYNPTMITGAETVRNNDLYLWKITPVTDNGVITGYKLTNKKTEGTLTFDANGTIADDKNDAVTRLLWDAFTADTDGKVKYFTGGGEIVTKKGTPNVILGVNGTSVNAGPKSGEGSVTSVGWAIYTQDEIELTHDLLNGLMGGKTFSLGFPKADPQPAENLLSQKLTAVTMDAADVTGWVNAASAAGTYFVVSYPEGAIDPTTKKFASEALFNASTFIAVEPEVNYGLSGNSRTNGYGFGLKVVNGRDLVSADDAAAKGQIAFANAQFKVTEKDKANNPGEYTVTVSPVVMTNVEAGKEKWEKKSNVTITAVTSAGTTYVMTSNGNATVCKAGVSNMVKASDILSEDGASIYTVQFLSGAKDIATANGSEYGKYLGIVNGTGIELLAQGPAYLNLDAPQNQWVVTAYNAANGSITFTNRELSTGLTPTTFTAILTKTETEGVYEVVSGTGTIKWGVTNSQGNYVVSTASKTLSTAADVKDMLIRLKPVTVDPAAGYADYTDTQLRDIATLKFSAAGLMAKTIYVGLEGDAAVGVDMETTQNDIEAAQWDVIKNTAVKDSIYGSTSYAYIKKGEETATKSMEDKAITTYKLKLRGTNLYLGYDNVSTPKEYELVAANVAPNFVIKENPDGTSSLILAGSSVYSSVIGTSTVAMSLDGNGSLTQDNIYNLANPSLEIELGQVTPSLESVARHASFHSVNGGFIAMGADRQAVIAATSEESANLTFWLDTVDVDAVTPAFYISQGIKAETKADGAEVRNYLWNPIDSAVYYNEGTASYVTNPEYYVNNNVSTGILKAIFKSATEDELVDANKFQIVLADEDTEGEYVIRSVEDGTYLANINGKVVLTDEPTEVLVVTLGEGDATANEAIAAEGVQVIGGQGVVTVQGAAGKVITVANILGQTIANQVAASDNVTIAAPAGVVVVVVDGDATKVVVK